MNSEHLLDLQCKSEEAKIDWCEESKKEIAENRLNSAKRAEIVQIEHTMFKERSEKDIASVNYLQGWLDTQHRTDVRYKKLEFAFSILQSMMIMTILGLLIINL